MHICDSVYIRKLDGNGIVTKMVGGGAFNSSLGDFGPATSAFLGSPTSIAFDATGNLYIADQNYNRVRKVHYGGDPTWLLSHVSTNNAGTYSVVVSSPYGSITSSGFNLTVVVPPQQFTSQFAGGGLHNGSSYTESSTSQSATNLTLPVYWQPVLTNPSDGNGNLQFTDTNLNGSQKFYRAVGQ